MGTGETIDILLVEDNPNDAELILRAIRRRNAATVSTVLEDGAAALDFIFARGAHAGRAGARPPKVILLDLKLPKVNGLEVLKAIKADSATRSIPVVIVTSSREDVDLATAYALGANSYVVKPVEAEAFVEAMGSLGFYWLVVNERPK